MCVPCFVNVECPSCHARTFEKLSHFIQCSQSTDRREFCGTVPQILQERGLAQHCSSCSAAILRRRCQASHVWSIPGLSPEESGRRIEDWMDRLDASEPMRGLLHNVARERAAEQRELLLQQAHILGLFPEITEDIQPPEGLRYSPLDGSEDVEEQRAHMRRRERSWDQANRQLQGRGTRRGPRMPREEVSTRTTYTERVEDQRRRLEQWNQWWWQWWMQWWNAWWLNNGYWLDAAGMSPNAPLQQSPFLGRPSPRLDDPADENSQAVTRRNRI